MTKSRQKLTILILAVMMAVCVVVGLSWGKLPSLTMATEQATVINPIAWYKLDNKDNIGEDSIGNYDMEIRGGKNEFTVDETNGGVSFNGGLCLAQDAESNMFADVSAFTLCFEIKTGAWRVNWQHYLGVGGTTSGFSIIGADNAAGNLYKARLQAPEINGTYWNSEPIFGNGTEITEYQKVVITVTPNGNLAIYLNGNAINMTKGSTVAKDFATAKDGEWFFSIGAQYKVGSIFNLSIGSVRNVKFYDFAMSATSVSAYNQNDQLTTSDVENYTKIDPIAWYKFDNASDLGKDSMGNYDMEYRRKWVSGATGDLLNTYTAVDEVNGGVTYAGNFCLAQDAESNMFADVTAFTLCFEIKTAVSATSWDVHIGVGNSSGDGFAFIGRGDVYDGQLRLQTPTMMDSSNAPVYSAPRIYNNGTTEPTEYQRIVATVQPGGNISVYLNGKLVGLYNGNDNTTPWDTSIGEDWATATKNTYFSIGGDYNGAVTKMASGSIRNVQFYDFAMDATCVKAYDRTGVVTTNHVSNLKSITNAQVNFDGEVTKSEITNKMTASEMLEKVNDATATLTVSDGSTESATIVWKDVVNKDGKYYVKGKVESSKTGFANLYGYEVSYELPVIEIVGDVVGASISAMEDFALNFYVKLPDQTQSATANMVMEGFEQISVVGVKVESQGAWRFTYPVPAKYFDKNVTLTIASVDGVTVERGVTATQSVKGYADQVKNAELSESVTQELKDVVSALSVYCEQAKSYFADKNATVDKVANGITSADLDEKYASSIEGEDENVTIVGASLVAESKTRIHVYFKSDSQVNCLVNGQSVTAQEVEGHDGMYVVVVEVLAKNLVDMYEIQIGNCLVNYGAFSYIRNCIDTVNAPLYNVLQALYNYGCAANEYFN